MLKVFFPLSFQVPQAYIFLFIVMVVGSFIEYIH